MQYLRSHGLINLQLMSKSIGNALFANALFTASDKFKFPNAGNASNSNGKPCSINVTDMLNMNKILSNFDDCSSDKRISNNIDSGESGWDFWSRVYDDPTLKSQITDHLHNAPTVSEMLTSEKLIRAQLIFFNVPRIGAASQQIIRSLIESECGKNIAIFDIAISNRRWRVRFYRCEDALEVFRTFNGYRFRNRLLSVRYEDYVTYKTFELGKEPSKLELESKMGYPLNMNITPSIDKSVWSATEFTQIKFFKNDLIRLLENVGRNNPGINIDDQRITQLTSRGSTLIEAMLKQWPVGLFRMCAPQVCLIGRYLSLGNRSQNAVLNKVAAESYPRIYVDAWEPFAPAVIHTKYHLVDYSCALLRHFGAQQVQVDLPWRILTTLLPSSTDWPQDSIELMNLVAKLSPHTSIFGGTLFLVSDECHRQALAQKLLHLPE
uniref:RRM domain-containing protein n=1 Tax=Elaeophora elaphi TaxID=1147741 RepID=A0A0R3RS09_9BILA